MAWFQPNCVFHCLSASRSASAFEAASTVYTLLNLVPLEVYQTVTKKARELGADEADAPGEAAGAACGETPVYFVKVKLPELPSEFSDVPHIV